MNSGKFLFLLIASSVAVGIVVGRCLPLSLLHSLGLLVAAVLSFMSFWQVRRGGVALASLLLCFFLLGFVRIQLPPLSLLPEALLSWSASLSHDLSASIHSSSLRIETAALLDAMLLGRRVSLHPVLVSLYRQAGASHLLALSGLHLTVVSGLLFLCMRYVLTTGWRYVVGILGLGVMWGYALLAGFPLSLCRASLMMSLLLISQMRLVGNNGWHTLGLTAFLLLMMNPYTLFDIGFQLSFSAVSGILLFYPLWWAIWMPRHAVLRWFWQAALVSLSAQLGVFPLLLHYFQMPPLSAFLFSPLYVLMATLLLYASLLFLLCTSVGGGMLYLTVFGSGFLLSRLIEWLVALQHGLMEFAVRLPVGGVGELHLSWYSVLLLYASLCCILPSLRALRPVKFSLPHYRAAAFFRTWPYLLASMALGTAAMMLG